MMTATQAQRATIEDLLRVPDKAEIVNGEIALMPPQAAVRVMRAMPSLSPCGSTPSAPASVEPSAITKAFTSICRTALPSALTRHSTSVPTPA